jgi:M6 family metalloprotease-like protein
MNFNKKYFVRYFMTTAVSVLLAAALCIPALAGVVGGITPAELDGMAVDPQSWSLHRDMTWDDYKPNPVIDWANELNPASLYNKFAGVQDPNPNRPIEGGLLLFQYLDRKFISSKPVGSDPMAYTIMNEKYGSNLVNNPVIDVYNALADEEGMSRADFVDKYTKGEYAADADGLTGLDKKFAQWWADYLNKPSESNNHVGISEFWRENSYGKWDVKLTPYGPYTIPYFEFETMGYDMGSSFQTYRDVPPSFRRGTGSGQYFRFDTISQGIARTKGIFDNLDFFFLFHAGYDESGVWQEFGQARYANRQDVPDELGPGPIMEQVEEFFTDPANAAEYLPIYIDRYRVYDNSTFRTNYAAFTAADSEKIAEVDDAAAAMDAATGPLFDLIMALNALKTAGDDTAAADALLATGNTARNAAKALFTAAQVDIAAGKFDDASTEITDAAVEVANAQTALDAISTELEAYSNPTGNAEAAVSAAKAALGKVAPADFAIVTAGLDQLDKDGGEYKFHLSQADWDWVDDYKNQTQKNTRYVSFTSWQAAIGEWSHMSTMAHNYVDPADGQTKSRSIRYSTQGENDGMAVFAHEFGHIGGLPDNYGNPWTNANSPWTEPWELMSRGSFAGPYGDHARWTVPGVEAGSVPVHFMQHFKNGVMEFNDADDVLTLTVEELAGRTPVVTNIVPRNIPLANSFYGGLAGYGLNKGDYYKGLKLDFGTGAWQDQNPVNVNTGFTNTTTKRATGVYVEVSGQNGYDSFAHDHGVLLSRSYTGSNPTHQLVDSHLYDIAMLDYTLGGVPAPYPLGHATQQADAAFKAGVSYTDTGYYATKYDRDGSGSLKIKTRPSNADLSATNWPLSPVAWEIAKTGSEARGELRDGRDIVAGDTVNEWYDAANKLRFYILRKDLTDGRQIAGETQKLLSYQVGALHENGKGVKGLLTLKPTTFTPAAAGSYATQTFEMTNTGATETDIVRVTLDGPLAADRTQEITVVTGRTESVTRTVPKPFSEQNAVILNNLYAIEPGETVTFDVYVKAASGDLTAFPYSDLTVSVASESSNSNSAEAEFAAPGAPTDVSAVGGAGQAVVSFTAPADDGGYPITSYTVTSDPGNVSATGASSPITVTGLTNGTSYAFTVTATNSIGTGAASAPSAAVLVSTASQDDADIALVKALIDGLNLTATQANADTEAAARGIVQSAVSELSLNSRVTATVTDVTFVGATAGTATNNAGTPGVYTFTVTLAKGVGTPATTSLKQLTITATPFTVNPADTDIATAKAAIESAVYTATQASAGSAAQAKTFVQSLVTGLITNGVSTTVDEVTFVPASTGTAANTAGTPGVYLFTVTLAKGTGTTVVTSPRRLDITATPITVNPADTDLAAAKAAIESAVYTATQANAGSAAQAKTAVQSQISGLSLNGVSTTINEVTFSPASTGTAANTAGTSGAYIFTVTLAKGTGTTVTTSPQRLDITADPFTVNPNDNATIGILQINLDTDTSGSGWFWNAASRELTITGGNVGAVDLSTGEDTMISVVGNANATNITNIGSGSIGIDVGSGKTLTVESTVGAAISAEGNIVIGADGRAVASATGLSAMAIESTGGKVAASTTDPSAAAIESTGGSVLISGSVNVSAAAAGGSAVKAADEIDISTSGGVTATTSGTGYGLDAGTAINVTGGHTSITVADDDHAFRLPPVFEGADEVDVNGNAVYSDQGKGSDNGGGGGGCDALTGTAMFAIIMGISAALYTRRTRKSGKQA